MEVKLEAQAELELGNALYPSFQDISGQGWLQEGTGWEASPAVARWFLLCAKSRLLLDLHCLLPTPWLYLSCQQVFQLLSLLSHRVYFYSGLSVGCKLPFITNLLLIIAVFFLFF